MLEKNNFVFSHNVANRASHPLNGAKSNELSFKENETAFVLEKSDSGWWQGTTCHGGWLPAIYEEVRT